MRPIDKIRKTKEIILIEQVRGKQILTSASGEGERTRSREETEQWKDNGTRIPVALVLGRNEEQGPKWRSQ